MDLKRYSIEIKHIFDKLEELENGQYYEKIKKPGVPSAQTIGCRLGEEILDLLEKIKNNSPGAQEKIDKAMDSINDLIR